MNRFSTASGAETEKRRRVSVLALACTIFFVVSGGPFSTEQVIGKSGPVLGLLLLAVLPVVWALPVGLLTAELSSAIPEEGGYYVWVKTALGPFAGFLAAWWSWLSSWVDLALYPLLAVKYAGQLASGGQIPHSYWWVLGLIAAFTYMNLRGIQFIGRLSEVLSLVVLVPFVALLGFGLVHVARQGVPSMPLTNPGVKSNDIGAAIVLALWNYFGWDSISTTAGEIQGAGSRLPKALMLAVGMVTAAVVLPVAAGVVIEHHWSKWSADAGYFPAIAAAAWPPLRYAMIVGGTVSNLGLFAANLLASSRIPYVLAGESYFPRFIFREHPRFGTPWVALLIAAGMCALFAHDSFENLVPVDLALYLSALLLEFAAWIVLRNRGLTDGATFRVRGGPVLLGFMVGVPSLVAIGGIGMQMLPQLNLGDLKAFHVTPPELLLTMLATGPLVYLACRRRPSIRV